MVELKFIGSECFYIENFFFFLFDGEGGGTLSPPPSGGRPTGGGGGSPPTLKKKLGEKRWGMGEEGKKGGRGKRGGRMGRRVDDFYFDFDFGVTFILHQLKVNFSEV